MRFGRRSPAWGDDSPLVPTLPRLAFDYQGTPGDDHLRTSSSADSVDMSQGGNDFVNTRLGDDTVYFGAAFTGADRVNGGTGFDTVTLDGDYSAGIDVQAHSLVNIEMLVLEGGPYVLTGDFNYQDSQGFTGIDASRLTTDESFTFDARTSLGELTVFGGSGVNTLDASGTSQTVALLGGASDDVLTGGSGVTTLIGFAGADTIYTNSDATVVRYLQQADSVAKAFDTIVGFQGRIELEFDSDTSVPEVQHDFHFGKTADRTGDILISYVAGKDETVVKVFTDADHKADFVVHLTGDVPLTPADFIFG